MNRLNNLFPTDENIDMVKEYLRTKVLPPEIKSAYHFRQKYKHFKLNNDDELLYEPLTLVVVKRANMEHILANLFKNDKNALGKGIANFYKYVCSKYINITRNDIKEFLKKQPNYQMNKPITHRVNKPIIAKAPNSIWCVDLIDLAKYSGHNNFFKYVMLIVDTFSRKVWLEKMRTKGALQTAKALQNVCQKANIMPSVIMSDNGTEFKGEFAEFCKEHEIKQNFSRTYTPQSNALAERSIQDIRKIMRAFMTTENDLNWASNLKAIEDNKNQTYNSNIKATPNEVWSPNKEAPVLNRDLPNILIDKTNKKLVAKANILRIAKKQIEKFQQDDNFDVGNKVRIKMSSIFSGVRRIVKQNLTKQLVITYTPETFRVIRVIIPRRRTLARRRYVVENSQGRPIYKPNGGIKQFFASELQLVADDENEPEISMERALKLNKVESTRNDLVY
jgi:hypothetical protein